MDEQVAIDQANRELVEFKLSELRKSAFMDLLKRISQECFLQCVKKIEDGSLRSEEKLCLNACYNFRLKARKQLMELILKDF